MATSDKLNKLLETKAAIKQAIIDKGVDVGEDVVFADYPDKISAIQSGGNGPDYTAVYLAQTNNGTTYENLFKNYPLTEINLDGYDTNNVTDMNWMFYNCNKLTSLDVSNFNTSKVTNMSNMFYSCLDLTELDVSNFNTSNVTDMTSMFSNCQKLITIGNLSNWNTSQVTNMGSMFSSCYALEELDIRNFDMTNVTKTTYMFYSCRNLHTLRLDNCSNDTISKIINSSNFAPSNYSATRRIYVNPDNIGDLIAPTKCVFINCLTGEEIVQE